MLTPLFFESGLLLELYNESLSESLSLLLEISMGAAVLDFLSFFFSMGVSILVSFVSAVPLVVSVGSSSTPSAHRIKRGRG